MGTISLNLPIVGQPNSTEDAKIPSALTAIQTLVNGNIDVSNLNPAAAILSAGAWVNLSFGGGIIPVGGGYNPMARLEGDIVRLKGSLLNTTAGAITAGSTWATLPSGKRPSATVIVTCNVGLLGGSDYNHGLLGISSSGLLSMNIQGPVNSFITLDGITFTLS